MKPRILFAVAAVLVLSSPLLYFGGQRVFNIWWQPPVKIEAYLQSHTPLGTSEEHVLSWLRARGVPAEVNRVVVAAHSEEPLTTTGGAAFIHCTIESHWFIFDENIVAFYTFDATRRLVDVRVRRELDGP